jgi:hypothetical protein
VRLGLERVPEEDQDVDAALGDPGADLLVAADRPTEEPGDRQAELEFQQGTGGSGGVQRVSVQCLQVVLGPAEQVRLLVVVRDQGYVSSGGGNDSGPSGWLRGNVCSPPWPEEAFRADMSGRLKPGSGSSTAAAHATDGRVRASVARYHVVAA